MGEAMAIKPYNVFVEYKQGVETISEKIEVWAYHYKQAEERAKKILNLEDIEADCTAVYEIEPSESEDEL